MIINYHPHGNRDNPIKIDRYTTVQEIGQKLKRPFTIYELTGILPEDLVNYTEEDCLENIAMVAEEVAQPPGSLKFTMENRSEEATNKLIFTFSPGEEVEYAKSGDGVNLDSKALPYLALMKEAIALRNDGRSHTDVARGSLSKPFRQAIQRDVDRLSNVQKFRPRQRRRNRERQLEYA